MGRIVRKEYLFDIFLGYSAPGIFFERRRGTMTRTSPTANGAAFGVAPVDEGGYPCMMFLVIGDAASTLRLPACPRGKRPVTLSSLS